MGRIIPYIMENKNMFQTTNQGQIGEKGGQTNQENDQLSALCGYHSARI